MSDKFWMILPLTLLTISLWSQSGTASREARVVDIDDVPDTTTSSSRPIYLDRDELQKKDDTETTTDFLSLQVSDTRKAVRVHHYLGVTLQGAAGMPLESFGGKPFHAAGGGGLSYLVTWGNNYIPYVGLETSAAAWYTYIFRNSYDKNHLINPVITTLLRVHLASPMYIGIGINFGVNIWEGSGSQVYVGPLVKIGAFQDFDGFGFDFSVFWAYHPEQSDVSYIYNMNDSHIRHTHSLGIVFGFYGLVG